METLQTPPAGNRRFTRTRVTNDAPEKRPTPRTTTFERRLILVVAGVAAVGAAFASGEPTSFFVLNVALRAAFGALVTLSASLARRWSWLVMAGVAMLAATGPWLVVAAAALLVGLGASLLSRRRIFGAVVGALAVQSLLRLPEIEDALGSAVVVGVAILPVLVSAYLSSPSRVRRRVKRSLLVAAGLVLLGVISFGIAGLVAYSSAMRGQDEAREGLASVSDGRTDRAADLLDKSSADFGEAHAAFSAWWAAPARAVPIVSQHADALLAMSRDGERVSAAAAATARKVDYGSLRYENGRLDLDRMRAVRQPLAETADILESSLDDVRKARSPWLIGALGEQIDEFDEQLTTASRDVRLASDASEVLPGMLGGDGVRRYFVAFITPAEERGLGGFMGNYAEIVANNGALTLSHSGRVDELNSFPGAAERTVTVDQDYATRYNRFRPGTFFQDVTLSPDMPSVARAISELYPKAGGSPIDGVLAVDPEGLAALLQITGPIRVDGLDTPLTAKNAIEILTTQQYQAFGDKTDRVDFLEEAGKKTFEKLIGGDLPAPAKLADVLGPVVQRQRLRFATLHPEETGLVRSLGASGEFPKADGGDFFSLRTQNRGQNKIDSFLDRKVDYEGSFDRETGDFQAHVEVTLHNGAPPSGLPDAILGNNDQGYPKGTNVLYFSFYTPHGLREAKIDGQVTGLEYQLELGYSVYSRIVTIPPGKSVTVTLELFGHLPSDRDYQLTISPQPMLNPDQIVTSVEAPAGFVLTDGRLPREPGFPIESGGQRAVYADTPERTLRLRVGFVER